MQISNPKLVAYARGISELHSKWKPHEDQLRVGRKYFQDGIQSIFVQCGRKWGKTELALYFLWRMAWAFPGSPCYYVAPYQRQAKEIVWADPRIKSFGPREWLLPGSAGINNTELRLNFTNGSFIKVDGSDNYEAYRGVRYKVAVYDEYKDHRPEFRKAMRPNASVLQGVDLFMGSPPDRECDYILLAQEHREEPDKYFHHAPTWKNPHIEKEWLAKEKKTLYKRGDGDEWEREYAAKYVKGGASKIFPMLGVEILKPHAEVMKELYRDRKKLVWMNINDPAAASCFASLFLVLNPFTKRLYCLDEIYEKEQAQMTVKVMGSRIREKTTELYDGGDDAWRLVYDEAETWWANEYFDHFGDYMEPSQKAQNDKESGLTLIKDILLGGRITLSDRCEKLYWELDNYFKDRTGKIPKANDHLIDCLRYGLGALYYNLNTETEYLEKEDEDFRGARFSADFPSLSDDGTVKSEWEDWN